MDTTRLGGQVDRQTAPTERRLRRERLAVGIALAGAILLLAIPRLFEDSVAIGSDLEAGVGSELATGEPFEARFSIDTESGSISSNVPSIGTVEGNVQGRHFNVYIWSGEGPVAIVATRPDGGVLIDVLVGPGTSSQQRLITRDTGVYEVVFSSEGSRGFNLSIYAQYTTVAWPWRDSVVLVILGLGFLVVVGLGQWKTWGEGQSRERILGAALLSTGLLVPLSLLLTGDHGWYWKPVTHLIWLVALAAIAVGSYLAVPPRVRVKPQGSGRRLLSSVFYLVVGFVVLVTFATSWVHGGGLLGLLGGQWSGSMYAGDYLIMGLHVVGFWMSGLLIMSAGLAAGRNRERPGEK